MKELSIEQKARAYDEAKVRMSKAFNSNRCTIEFMNEIFPELAETEDEKIRKEIIDFLWKEKIFLQESYSFTHSSVENCPKYHFVMDAITWLEKQGKETSWKPSKEEMDVLYSLAYITNQYDEHKEEVITRLYQDLKREFFNDSSYENMFPTENDVRRRSTIQVLEYARSLDAYNQFGKADIDKNIAWLEKQGEQKSDNKIETKFHEGDWIVSNYNNVAYIESISETKYNLQCKDGHHEKMSIKYIDRCWHLWTIKDAKEGDVLAVDNKPFIYNGSKNEVTVGTYCGFNAKHMFSFAYNYVINQDIIPATKEQCDLLFEKMKEAGWEWNTEKKELKKIVQKPIDKVEPKFHEGDWVVISTSDGEKVVQINSVEYFKNGEPRYITSEGRWFGNGTNAHLWTIQDAKPGDVLANDYNIFIFSHHSITRAMSYCHINLDDMRFYDDKGMNFGLIDVYVTPATKEQCNTLFTKMKEAGYEWNTEEKELRKIE